MLTSGKVTGFGCRPFGDLEADAAGLGACDQLGWSQMRPYSMHHRVSTKGCIVRVTTNRLGGGPPSVEIYDGAIPGAVDAIKAARRVL